MPPQGSILGFKDHFLHPVRVCKMGMVSLWGPQVSPVPPPQATVTQHVAR